MINDAQAFSPVAAGYDATFTETATGRFQRRLVWQYLEQNITGMPQVLELNCGTGADACWMARRGWQVLATDASPEMVRITGEKAASEGLSSHIRTETCAFSGLSRFPGGSFDLVFSDFGGVNCISPEAFVELTTQIQRLLRPGGQAVLVVMGRFCWWETLYFLLKFKPRIAFRRNSAGPVPARLDADTVIPTWYYRPSEVMKFFRSPVNVRAVRPVGYWIPPSYLDPFFSRRLPLLRVLWRLEQVFRARWWAHASDHYLIHFQVP